MWGLGRVTAVHRNRLFLWGALCFLGYACGVLAAPIYKYVDARGVVTYTDKAVRGAQVFRYRDDIVERFDRQIRLEKRPLAAGHEALVVYNDLYAPVEIALHLESLRNVANAPERPIRQIIPPRTHVTVWTLKAVNSALAMQYVHKLRHDVGDPRPSPDRYRYALPWQGGTFRITQGPNGRYSHDTPKGRYAVDVAMPEGTPIVAARAGQVVKVENTQTGRGNHPSGNFVRVLHDDGTMSVYLHLMKGSVRVQEGQSVRLGQLLAHSGSTGNSTGPHLHFVVQRNMGLSVESIPFEFAQPVGHLPNFAQGNRPPLD